MRCESCGCEMPDQNKFCTNCGARLVAQVPTPEAAPEVTPEAAPEVTPAPTPEPIPAPAAEPIPENVPESVPVAAPAPAAEPVHKAQTSLPGVVDPKVDNVLYPQDTMMKWFKYLTSFALFADALLYFFVGLRVTQGGTWGDKVLAQLMYEQYPVLQIADLSTGLLTIIASVLFLVSCFMLKKYKKNGPKILVLAYGLLAFRGVANILASSMILGVNEDSISSGIMGVTIYLALVVINLTYFKKRSHLFVN